MSTLVGSLPINPALLGVTPAPAAAAPRPQLLGPDAGVVYRVLGQTVTFKVTSEQTGGAYALFELAWKAGAGTPPRREPRDAAFVVLEGELTILLDGRTHVAGPGACVFVPRGATYAYTNAGAAEARVLVLVAPGARPEVMFADLDAWARLGGPGGGAPDVGPDVTGAATDTAHGTELPPAR